MKMYSFGGYAFPYFQIINHRICTKVRETSGLLGLIFPIKTCPIKIKKFAKPIIFGGVEP
jgi:hypothetical protein